MGVGFAVDLVVCTALGVDMFDCVFPTRTAVSPFQTGILNHYFPLLMLFSSQRFGVALVNSGSLHLKQTRFSKDMGPIDPSCPCTTCKTYSRAYLHTVVNKETVACHLLSIHNITYQLRLMTGMRNAIIADNFPEFVRGFMKETYNGQTVPEWVTNALSAVKIEL